VSLVPMPAVRWIGPGAIVGLAAGYAALWFAAAPAGQPGASYLGQFLGAEAVLLLSLGLILISTLPWVEVLFDGIDKAAVWHRRVAITGVVLLIPHILLAASPHRSSLGPLLAVIGVIGVIVLIVWAVLPRWRSVVPRAFQGPVLAVRRLPGARHLRRARPTGSCTPACPARRTRRRPAQSATRPAAEHRHDTRGRRRQADRQGQQRALARAVRADQRGHVPGGDRQGALTQRPRAAVPLAQAARLNDIHATASIAPPAAPPRVSDPLRGTLAPRSAGARSKGFTT
jgi:hypothetical protein